MVEKKVNEVVEGYRVMGLLGKGAASIVYWVQEPKTSQIWALKHVVREGAKDQRFLDQAESEYEIARQFDHPTIRKIPNMIKRREYLIGSAKELYLVMEFTDGKSIDVHPPKSLINAVETFQKVAEGLAHMHERGYVHADMKPNNVIVDDDGGVKIIDLGQACKIGTIKERIQGTPDYIAPEQVHRRAITAKTDVYNFGATMYWCLMRKPIPTALGKDDKLVGSLDDHMIERPAPITTKYPKINPKLNDLIMQCVEPDPSDRPESMRKVAEQLNLILGMLKAEQAKRASASGSSKSGAAMNASSQTGYNYDLSGTNLGMSAMDSRMGSRTGGGAGDANGNSRSGMKDNSGSQVAMKPPPHDDDPPSSPTRKPKPKGT